MAEAQREGWWIDRKDDPSHGYCIMAPAADEPSGARCVAGGLSLDDAKAMAVAPELADLAQLILDFYGMETRQFVDKYGHGVSTRTIGKRAEDLLRKAGLR